MKHIKASESLISKQLKAMKDQYNIKDKPKKKIY